MLISRKSTHRGHNNIITTVGDIYSQFEAQVWLCTDEAMLYFEYDKDIRDTGHLMAQYIPYSILQNGKEIIII